MRTLRTLVGMPVVCGSRRIGWALRAELTGDLRQLKGLWISAGLKGARFIPAESLEMLGEVAVMCDGAGSRCRMRADVLPMRAVSTDGKRLGAITGAEVDEVSFAVSALELSEGLWDDLARQRQRVTRYTVSRDGSAVIIEPTGYEREVDEHEGRTYKGPVDGDAGRRIGGHDLWNHELADGEKMEPEGQADGQLDL